jgi:hypothetical protein
VSAQPAQFALGFRHYAALGYDPCPTNGKVPAGGTGWYTQQYNAEALTGLDENSDFNVGLRCSNIVGLDIDVLDAKLAAEVERVCRKVLKLPKSTPRRIGNAPKALLVARVNDATKGFDIKAKIGKDNVTLFQCLGAGKQFVVHGIHPDTHKPYTLSAPLPKHSALRLLTTDDLVHLKAALLELFEAAGYAVRSTGATGKAGSGKWSDAGPWTKIGMEQAWDAMQALDPDMSMDEWVQVGFALYDGTHGSDEGLEMWDAWSSNSGGKYRPGDCERRWRGFKPGGGVTKATLFKNSFPKLDAGSPHEPPVRIKGDDNAPGIDISDLLDHEPGDVPWIVQDLMTYGAHLLVGRPKGGKSWITMDMVYACANAGTFLGMQARKCGVLWLSAEDSNDTLARRLKVRKERASGVTIMTRENLKAERATWDDDANDFSVWLRDYLVKHPDIGLVIVDTHTTVESIWKREAIDERRSASVVAQAYQMSRIYEDIGHETQTCIVLVHHAAKLKNMRAGIVDYHELVNLPATVVAGATASLVLADPPDRDLHDEDDHRRIFAMRGRNIIKEVPLLIELKDARAKLLGTYVEVTQSETQAETMAALEALLAEQEPDAKGERWVTYKALAQAIDKHEKTIAGHFKAMKKDPKKLVWKGAWRVELKQGKGARLVAL